MLRAKLDELAAEAAYAFIHAGDYEALINSPIKSDFSKLSHEDPSMYAAYYLAVTRRAALIGTNADFNTLIEALPDNYSHDGEALFKELYIASGDPAVQYASARAYAREHESEAEFLNLGMELSAKAAAGEDTGIPMLAETLALLPSASVLPGGSHAIWEDDFPFALEEQKEVGSYDLPEIDFRAKEPYPLNYAVVVDNSSMRNPFASLDNPDTGLYAAKLAIGALAKAGTDSKAYRYNVIENPDAAAFLIRVHIYYNTIAGKYYPSNAIRLTERDAYQCYLECATYNLYDTETGKRIARGTLTADTPDHVLTENFYKQSFWVKIDHYGDADEKAAKAFRAITDAKVQALDDK